MFSKWSVLFTLLLLYACHQVPQGVQQSNLYLDVMQHYKRSGCHDKKEAALFLFQNISEHHTYVNQEAKLLLDSCALSYVQCHQAKNSAATHASALHYIKERLHPVVGGANKQYDIDHLSSSFIINNIDSSYQAWKKTREVGQIDFNMYCHYILPYRIIHEPIDEDYECAPKKKYKHLIDTLIRGVIL